MAADICVNVAKFSHATGVRSDNAIPWTHLVASDVFLILKGQDTHRENDQLWLQVIQGNNVLEAIDIGKLVDKAVEARHGSQQAGISPQIEQLPIFGIYKEIFLAFRYRLPDGQARRVQFRLPSAQDCARLVAVLQQRGMEFQQQRPRTGRPATARPDTANSEMRSMTMQSTFSGDGSSTGHTLPTQPSPFQMQALEAGGLSSRHAKPIPFSQARDTHRPPSAVDSFAKTSSAARAMASNVAAPDVPSMDQSKHFLKDWNEPPDRRNQTVSRGDFESTNNAHQMVDSTTDDRGQATPAPHSSSSARYLDMSRNESPRIAPNSSEFPSVVQSGDRRCSSAVSSRMPETLEHEMPPRRELPFNRVGSHQSTDSRPSSKAKAILRPMTTNAVAKSANITSMLASAKQPTAPRPVTASPLKRLSVLNDEREAKKAAPTVDSLGASITSGAQASRVTSASTIARTHTSRPNFRRPSDIGELLRNARPLAERSTNSKAPAREDSTADAAYELETPPPSSSSPKKKTGSVRNASSSLPGDGAAAKTQATYKANGTDTTAVSSNRTDENARPLDQMTSDTHQPDPGMESASLAAYASQSREDRQTVLDEFMVARLEDPNFATLCEDLDNCWRRIALGL